MAGLLSQGQPGLETSDGPDHRMDPGLSDPAPLGLEEPGPQQQTFNPPNLAVDIPISVGEPSREPSPAQANRSTPHSMPPPATLPSSTATTSMPQLDSITASYYQPATAEDFRAHRRRVQQQETMSFGPFQARSHIAFRYASSYTQTKRQNIHKCMHTNTEWQHPLS